MTYPALLARHANCIIKGSHPLEGGHETPTSVLAGTNLTGQSVVWGGTSVVWGGTSMQGYSAIWGTSVVWGGTSTDAGEATAIAINGEN